MMVAKSSVRRSSRRVLALVILAALGIAGCGTGRSSYRQGEQAAQRELWDTAVLSYAKAVAEEPGNTRYKVALDRARLRASTVHFDRGKRYMQNGQLELAVKELQQAVLLDRANQYAFNELNKANTELERRRRGPSDYDKARTEAEKRAQSLGPPKLDPTSNIPIVLRFPDSTVGEVYETLSKTSGINFLYDDKLDLKKKLSVDLANVTFEKAMDILMLMNKHAYKVIDGHTIMLFEDNRQKHTEYDDHVIRTFYLSNAETQEIQTLLRSLLETRRVAENKNLNAITLKDTPEKIKVAERIIKANDKARGEVIVDIELLEINRTKSQTLGLDLSSKSLSLAFGDGKQSVPLNNLSKLNQQSNWSIGVIPSVTLDFLRSDSDSKTISRPQVRILEGDNGKITIGDRVPIPATSFNTSQTIGGNIVPVTSFTYQNVGIILEIKPRVHHNKEITLDIKAEVSSLAGSVSGTGGVSQPIIGTRSVETTVRLQDGETNLLAGLIKEEESTSLSGVPGVSQIPILRRLFGKTTEDAKNTDIVLSITPHIVRVPNIEPVDLVPLWVGSEDQVQLRGVARNALGESPFADGSAPWDDIDKQIGVDQKTDPNAKPGDAKAATAAGKAGGAGAGKPGAGTANAPAAGTSAAGGNASDTPPPAGGGRRKQQNAGAQAPPPAPVPDANAGGGADQGAPPADSTQKPEQPPKPLSAAQIRLAPDRPQVNSGDAFSADVYISGAEDVAQANFQLRYDPKVVKFVPPAQPGDFLSQGGAPVDLQVVETGDGAMIVVSAARNGPGGASGAGRIVRLNFVALSKGNANFGFITATIRGTDSQPLPAAYRASNVEVAQ